MEKTTTGKCNATRPSKTDNEKTAEFARLFYFFEKLAQPRTRPAATSTSSGAEAWVPKDMEPLLKKLTKVLVKDASADDLDVIEPAGDASKAIATGSGATPSSTSLVPSIPTRQRRNTLATPSIPHQKQASFPLGAKRYPFTFKMMLHKLYDLEDWAAKVREVVATSQEQYRSLEERGRGSPPRATMPMSPGTIFTELHSPPSSPTAPSTRRRATSLSKGKFKDMANLGHGLPSSPGHPQARAVKKRIVDRRRSVSGPDAARADGWVYAAAASSFDTEAENERRELEKCISERSRKRVVSSVGFGEMEKDAAKAVGKAALRVHFEERRPMKRMNMA
ncbi:hypothetical protein DENSPDRAFT_547787 [Dentipellis sp. KUC8613]|nr:hypothetical protein DENSPDRAFT_547787 [Dentipellis sp. KUC8613]